MKWIKSSERLPDEMRKYFVRYIATGTRHFIRLQDLKESKDSYEWLDESEPTQQDENEIWIEVVKLLKPEETRIFKKHINHLKQSYSIQRKTERQ